MPLLDTSITDSNAWKGLLLQVFSSISSDRNAKNGSISTAVFCNPGMCHSKPQIVISFTRNKTPGASRSRKPAAVPECLHLLFFFYS